MAGVDPITLEVIRRLLIAIMDEAEINLSRTAFSPIIYEVKDYCIGLLDGQGRTIAQSRGSIPTFMADLGDPVRDGIEIFGPEGFDPGDVMLMNYAAVCGQHLNNMVVYVPVHWKGRLVGFVASRAHWTDVGGRAPGSFVTDTTDIFQEGLQLRSVKVYKRGRPDEELLRVIRHNVRFPELSLGDMEAQIAACEVGRQRYLAMIDKYGWETIAPCVGIIWDQSEAFARERIRAIPDGVYEAESFLDDDGVNFDRTLPIRVRVVVEGDRLVMDFSGIAEQTQGPMNSGRSGGVSAAKVAFKSAVIPEVMPNEGAFRPLEIVLPPGTIISATDNAPLASWTVTLKTVIDTIYRALSAAIPDRIPAAHHGSMGAYVFYGRDPDAGRHYSHLDSALGGWGGRWNSDGFSPLKTVTHGDTRNVPVEVEETFYPVLVEGYGWRADSAGPGKYRGGLGLRKVYRLPHGAKLIAAFERSKCAPWGLFGGGAAQVGGVVVHRPNGSEPQRLQKVTGLELEPGARVEILSAGGGGWGAAFERDPARVLADVRQGYVTVEGARRDYGVAIDRESLQIDEGATRALRRVMRDAVGQGAGGAAPPEQTGVRKEAHT